MWLWGAVDFRYGELGYKKGLDFGVFIGEFGPTESAVIGVFGHRRQVIRGD